MRARITFGSGNVGLGEVLAQGEFVAHRNGHGWSVEPFSVKVIAWGDVSWGSLQIDSEIVFFPVARQLPYGMPGLQISETRLNRGDTVEFSNMTLTASLLSAAFGRGMVA